MKSIPRRDADPENGYSRRTINVIMKLIKKALKEAVRLEALPRNPADGIELLADDRRERGILTPDELQRLFQLEWPDERSKAAAILASVSGMRINEITALRREDLDMERQVINLRHSYSVYEKRLKGTKNERPRFIYTDASILTMLVELHEKSPLQSPFVFWGVESGKPMRYETIEAHLEKVLAVLMGEQFKAAVNSEWRSLATVLVPKLDIENNEIIAVSLPNINSEQDSIHIRHRYSCMRSKAIVKNYTAEKIIPLDHALIQRLSHICGKNPHVFVVRGTDSKLPLDFKKLDDGATVNLCRTIGEIIRNERNLTFHGFRHFFNSTIRGNVNNLRKKTRGGQAPHAPARLWRSSATPHAGAAAPATPPPDIAIS